MKQVGKAEFGKPEFLAADQACKVIPGPTPGLKVITFDSSGFRAEETYFLHSKLLYRVTLL